MRPRGGVRCRSIVPVRDAAVWVSAGRWGPRRARVESCPLVHRAEDIYDDLLRRGERVQPGRRGTLHVTFSGNCAWAIQFVVTANAIWRNGRIFLVCQHCDRRATRLYHPTTECPPRCRRCWGLNYECQSWSYRHSTVMARLFGSTAIATTSLRRDKRRSRKRRGHSLQDLTTP